MKTVNVHAAKTHFSTLLARVEQQQEEFLICRNGKPVANLVPHRRQSRLRLHPVLRKVKLKYDPVEPLSRDEWPRED